MKMNICFVSLFCTIFINLTDAFLTDDPYCSHGDPLPNIFCGRGPSSQMCPSEYFCHVHPADAWAVCCLKGVRSRRSNSQIDLLRNKLMNLQSLLKDIESEHEKSQEETDIMKKAKESEMNTSEAARVNISREKLTPNQVAILKALKETLSRKKEEKEQDEKFKQELKNKGTFYDESKEFKPDDVSILKALASQLSKSGNQVETKTANGRTTESTANSQTLNTEGDDLSADQNDVQPKEGKFTLFRQEVLAQVEDRLLQDMDFAVKMGFSIKEILKDLQIKEKRFEELKIEELKKEIERLKLLRGRE